MLLIIKLIWLPQLPRWQPWSPSEASLGTEPLCGDRRKAAISKELA